MSRTQFATILAALVCLGSSAIAQFTPPAPPQMDRFKGMAGDWEGSGTATMAPGQVSTWTARSQVRMVMGGHFLKEEGLVSFDAGGRKIDFIHVTFYGFDQSTGRHVSYSLASNGTIMIQDVEWAGDDKLVSFASSIEDGKRLSERWVTTVAKDTMSFDGMRMMGAAAPATTVQGTMKRVEKTAPIPVMTTGPLMPGLATDEMKRINRTAGKYQTVGKWRLSGDAEMMEFAGTETLTPLFGGTVLMYEMAGPGYEGFGAMAWNPARKCYERFGLNSMGSHHPMDMRWEGKKHIVGSFEGDMMGTRTTMRSILEVDDAGRMIKGWAHSLVGIAAPFKSYEGTYTLQKADSN